MKFDLCLILRAFSLFSKSVFAAGVGVHTTLISRIHHYLPLEIQADEFYPFLLAGSFFPDAFYSCGNDLHNASEYLHWPPFLADAVRYYKKNIEATENSLHFKAFLYGVFTHQVVDSSWHSIKMDQGLLPMLANMEFNGVIDDTHSFLDTAGDFLHLLRIDDVEFYRTGFDVPNIDDLIEIFAKAGFDISASTLSSCTLLGETALSSELRVRKVIGKLNARTSPLLDDVLESYYLGGIQEITNSILTCLPTLDQWFEEGPSRDSWYLCGAIIKHPFISSTDKISIRNSQNDITLTPWIPHGHFGHSISVGNFLQEPSIAIGANYEETFGSVYVLPLSEFSSTSLNTFVKLRSPGFNFPHRFGSKILSYNLMGQDFLIVSEPGTSTIYLYSGNNRILSIVDPSSNIKYGSRGVKESYTSIFVYDMDGSGFPSIILGSPYNDYDGHSQRGKVTVLSGRRIAFLLLSASQEKEINVKYLVENHFSIPHEYTFDNGYEQFGAALTVDDDFIYVTSNGHGSVFVLSYTGELEYVIYKEDVEALESGRRTSKESERFGSNWIISGNLNGIDYLLVSAHRSDGLWSSSSGAVFVYVIKDCSVSFKTKLVIRPGHSFVKFGWFGVVNEGNLYISSPGYNYGGAIFRAKLDRVLNARSTEFFVDEIILENKQGVYTGFGESFAVLDGKLIVGEPQHGFTELFNDDVKLTGRVLIHEL